MKLGDYRVEAGVYDVGRYRIYWMGSRCWSLRDSLDDMIDEFTTLRGAIKYAQLLNNRDVARGW